MRPLATLMDSVAARSPRRPCAFASALFGLLLLLLGAAPAGAQIVLTEIPCPSGPLVVDGGQQLHLIGDCTVPGDISVLDGVLVVSQSNLTVQGNVNTYGTSVFRFQGGTLIVPQQFSLQRAMTAWDTSWIQLAHCEVITNTASGNRFMSFVARNSGVLDVDDCRLDTNKSWLLGAITERGTLRVNAATNVPTEIYPIGAGQITVKGRSEIKKAWLRFETGTHGHIALPVQTERYTANFGFGVAGTSGVAWKVGVDDSRVGLGLNTWSGSDVTLVGAPGQEDGPRISINLQVHAEQGPEVIAGISPGFFPHLHLTSGRNLELWGVRVRPFGWQVYARDGAFPVIVRNATVNEVAAFSGGTAVVEDSLMQIAAGGALGQDSLLLIRNSQIHSQVLLAEGNGIIVVEDSEVHGSRVQAVGDAQISLRNAHLLPNGDGSPCPLPDDGIVSCNPFVAQGVLSEVVTADNGTVFLPPAYGTCQGGAPALLFAEGPAPAPGGSVQIECDAGGLLHHDETDAFPYVSLGDDGTLGSGPYLPGTTYSCTLEGASGAVEAVQATTAFVCEDPAP